MGSPMSTDRGKKDTGLDELMDDYTKFSSTLSLDTRNSFIEVWGSERRAEKPNPNNLLKLRRIISDARDRYRGEQWKTLHQRILHANISHNDREKMLMRMDELQKRAKLDTNVDQFLGALDEIGYMLSLKSSEKEK